MHNQTFVVWALALGMGIFAFSYAIIPLFILLCIMALLCVSMMVTHMRRMTIPFSLFSCLFFFLLGYVRA